MRCENEKKVTARRLGDEIVSPRHRRTVNEEAVHMRIHVYEIGAERAKPSNDRNRR